MNNLISQVDIGKFFSPAKKFPNETFLGPTVKDLYNIAIFFAFIIAFILIIWGGIKLITASGDPKAVEAGRKTITFAIVGLILIIAAYFIVFIVQKITGLVVVG